MHVQRYLGLRHFPPQAIMRGRGSKSRDFAPVVWYVRPAGIATGVSDLRSRRRRRVFHHLVASVSARRRGELAQGLFMCVVPFPHPLFFRIFFRLRQTIVGNDL